MKYIELYELAQVTGKALVAETNANKLDEAITVAATAGGVDNADLPLFKRFSANAATNYRHLGTQVLASEVIAQRAAIKKKADDAAALADKSKETPAATTAKTPKA